MSDKPTYAHAYKDKEGKFRWRFIIKGDIRAVGTNPHDTIEDAINDFNEIIEYTTDKQKEGETK